MRKHVPPAEIVREALDKALPAPQPVAAPMRFDAEAHREWLRLTWGDRVFSEEEVREMVIECVRHLPATFRYADIEHACPGVSRPTIVRALGELRDKGEIHCVKGGRDATWERFTS